jgi:hypothetical protein
MEASPISFAMSSRIQNRQLVAYFGLEFSAPPNFVAYSSSF